MNFNAKKNQVLYAKAETLFWDIAYAFKESRESPVSGNGARLGDLLIGKAIYEFSVNEISKEELPKALRFCPWMYTISIAETYTYLFNGRLCRMPAIPFVKCVHAYIDHMQSGKKISGTIRRTHEASVKEIEPA